MHLQLLYESQFNISNPLMNLVARVNFYDLVNVSFSPVFHGISQIEKNLLTVRSFWRKRTIILFSLSHNFSSRGWQPW
jgi:hypothetical protein